MHLEIEYLPTADLIPYARNARTHSDQQVGKIASSIREFGFVNPILVDEKNGIIAGHGRLMAAQKLGMEQVPTIKLEHLTETQRRALVLADNRLALDAGWDMNMLALELQDLKASDFDLDITGFDAKELNDIFSFDPKAGETEADAIPAVPAVAITLLGDMWICGKHRVRCGDSTQLFDIEDLMRGEKADLINTDPPYGVNFDQSQFRARDNSKHHHDKGFDKIENDAKTGAELTQFIRDAFTAALACSKSVSFYCWAPSLRQGTDIYDGLVQAGLKIQSQIIWRKDTFVVGRADYQWQHEVCWYGYAAEGKHAWYGARDKGTVWDCPRPRKMELHPTTKPVELFEKAIRNSSKGGDIVLDMFGGSGTTMIACERLERCARLMELSPVYVDVIVKRWQEFTGGKATHAGSGKTFDEIAAERGANLSVSVGGKN
jgi:DNA modification methylase